MRYLIVSDIHGNWEALAAVLDAAADKYDEVVCCGDVVGYGADPNRVVEWVRQHAAATIRGNHDRACATLEDIEWFNPLARAATVWTHHELTEENRAWLIELPKGPVNVNGFSLVHGSPGDEDEYVLSLVDAAIAFESIESQITFFGHTHVQCGFEYSGGRASQWRRVDLPMVLHDDAAYLINVGSTGQPRDANPRAAWGLFDSLTKTLSLERTAYDVDQAQSKILAAGLPDKLAERLEFGR